MRGRIAACAVCLAGLLLAPGARAAGSSLVASFTGPTAPQSQGWFLQLNGDPIAAFDSITPAIIADDLGFPVYGVDDRTALAGVYFEDSIAPQQEANAKAAGFTLRMRLRVLPEPTPIDPAAGLSSLSVGRGSVFELRFGANPDTPGNGNLRILATGGPPEVEIAGGSVYHLVEIVFDPVSETADVLVDGVERISDWVSPGGLDLDLGPVWFGSPPPAFTSIGAMGEARTNLVELEIQLPDCDDGQDNDADGLVDLEDPGCLALEDTSELDGFACNDGDDNDGDTLVDLADPGCSGPTDEIEFDVGAGGSFWQADLTLTIEPGIGRGVPPVQLTRAGIVGLQSSAGGVPFMAVPSIAGSAAATGGTFFEGVEVAATLSAGTLAVATGGPSNTLPLRGESRLCIIDPSCFAFLSTPFSGPLFEVLGGGGAWTSQPGTFLLSFTYAPWTLGTASVFLDLPSSPPATITRRGYRHGPLSLTSTFSATGGVVQLVTPMQIRALNFNDDRFGLFATLRVHFVPEPTRALLLTMGAMLLAWLGSRRARS